VKVQSTYILDYTILQLGLHILCYGLHKIGWTARLEYALAYTDMYQRPLRCATDRKQFHIIIH